MPNLTPPADLDRLRQEYADRERRFAGSDIYTFYNTGNLFIIQQRERDLLALLKRGGFLPLERQRILEVGCGRGGVLQQFLLYGAAPARLAGVDLLADRLAEARQALPGRVSLACADGEYLPFPAGTFDLAVQFTMFSSILDNALKGRLAADLLRVLRRPAEGQPGGAIVWYDFWWNPTNPQTRGIRPGEIRSLFPGCALTLQRVTLAPPLARRLASISWTLCAWLEKLRLFNSHYLALIRPASTVR
jgi:SAM-dependent methyltransferase